MNKILCLCFFSLFINICNAQKSETKVLIVILDGISSDVIEKVQTPHIDVISKEGGYTHAYVGGKKDGYSETPTISAVGYNSLLTGTWVNKHNVWGNSIKDPNYNYWTIFRFAKEYRPELKTAIFSTWLDNRTKLVGEDLLRTGNIKLDYHFDGFEKDTINFPHDTKSLYIHNIDEHVVTEASRYIKEKAPDLSWVYLQYTDDIGHEYGESEQFYNSVKIADDQIGRLWEAIKYREKNHKEKWQIYITTDHGRDKETGMHHGGQSERERRTWIVTNAKGLNDYYQNEEPGIVDILPTMLRELNISPKKEQQWEFDGVSFIGSISVASPTAVLKENEIALNWNVIDPKGKLEIWVSTTNLFAKGMSDKYILIDKVATKLGKAVIDISSLPSNFYKIVLKGKYNTVNTWVVKK
jgi:predicted AlkP superfamily pyrophosphatase or phosphodiesterase